MKTKTFDCVKMKEDCQRACEEKYAGLSFEDRQKKMEEDILASPILGDFYRQTYRPHGLELSCEYSGCLAEPAAQYGAGEQAK
jgi:hypothetical protein